MKTLAFILLISFNLSAQSLPQQDKLLHLSACYVIGASTTSIASYRYNKKQAFWIGVTTATLVGIGKELYDINHGSPQWGDLGADVIGAILGSYTVTIRF